MATMKILATAGLAAAAGLGVGAAATSLADTTSPSATSSPSSSSSSSADSNKSSGDDASKDATQDCGPRAGKGARGMHKHTEVTGTAATSVKNAVTAKYPGATIEKVLQDEDGSYDVLATKSGDRVMYEVSKDLKTITERTGGPGKGGPRGERPAPPTGQGQSGDSSAGSSTTSPSGTAQSSWTPTV